MRNLRILRNLLAGSPAESTYLRNLRNISNPSQFER